MCHGRADSLPRRNTGRVEPNSPLPTGSGAHGLRRQVNALAGVFASKHALAERMPNASVMEAQLLR